MDINSLHMALLDRVHEDFDRILLLLEDVPIEQLSMAEQAYEEVYPVPSDIPVNL